MPEGWRPMLATPAAEVPKDEAQWTPPIDALDDVATLVSPRELDILRLAAAGYDNDAIAADLFLSVRTVERHLQNAYAKLGLSGRTARTAAVARLLSKT